MADVSLTIALLGIKEAQEELDQLSKELEGVGQSAAPTSRSLMDMGKSLAETGAKITLATAPLTLFAKSTLDAAGDFQSSMNLIRTVVGATADEMEQISAAALKIGADTKFGANDAAQAMLELGKAGIPVRAALDGVLAATVDLAAAAGVSLPDAASTASDAFNLFGKNVGALPAMMDQILNAANATKFSFEDMSYAIARGGTEAAKLNVPFDEFATVISLTASSFKSGMDAGTGFSYFLSGLNPQTKRAKEAMEELGLYTARTGSAFYDANGQLKPMPEVIRILTDAMGGLTTEQLQTASTAIFSREAFGTLVGILREGTTGYAAMHDAVTQTGTAQRQSQSAMEGYKGSVEQLAGAIETLQIAIGNAGLLDWIADVALGLAKLVGEISQADPAVIRFGTVIAGVAIATGPVLVALGAIVTAVGALISPIGLAVTAVALLGGAAVVFADDVLDAANSVSTYLGQLWSDWDGTFTGLGQIIEQAGGDIGGALNAILSVVAGWATDFAVSIASAAQTAGQWLIDNVSAWDIANALGVVLVAVARWQTDFVGAILSAAVQAGAWLIGAVADWDIKAGLDALLAVVGAWASDFTAGIGIAAQVAGEQLIQTVSDWDIAAGLTELLTEVAGWATDFAVSVGAAATAAGEWLIDTVAGWDLASGLDQLLTVVAGWATDFAVSVGAAAQAAGAWLIDAVQGWDLPGALATLLTVVTSWASAFAAGIAAAAQAAGQWLVDTVEAWDLASGLSELLVAVADWAGDFATSVASAATEAGAWLIDTVASWDMAGALDVVLIAVADWATDFATSVAAVAIEAGDALIETVSNWDMAGALGTVLIAVAEWSGDFVVSVGAVAAEAGAALWDGIENWAPEVANKLGYVVGYGLVELAKFVTGVAEIAAQAVAALGDAWTNGVSDIDWTGAIGEAVQAIYEILSSIIELGVQVVEEFGKGFVEGMSDALGVDLIDVVGDAMTGFYDVIVAGLGEAYDGAVLVVSSMVDAVVQWFVDLPGRITTALTNIYEAITSPFQKASDEVQGHSIVPDMVDGVLAEFDRMVDGVQTKTTGIIQPVTASFDEMSAKVSEAVTKIAAEIGNSDWGLPQKMAAFQELGEHVKAAGDIGTAAMAALHKEMVDAATDAAGKQLKEIMDEIGLSAQQQLDKVLALRTEFQGYGEVAGKALQDITAKVQELYAEIAGTEIDKIFDNQTLSIQEQGEVLEALRQKYVAMGEDGKGALAAIQPEIDKVNQKLLEQQSVWLQVGAALNDNVEKWGGWGQSVGDIVSMTSKSATDTLAQFFMTGKLDLGDFVETMKKTFATEAAQAVVAFTSQGIKDFLGFKDAAVAAATGAGTGITTSMQQATTQSGTLLGTLGALASKIFGGIGTEAQGTGQTITQSVGQATTQSGGFFTQLGNVAQQVWAGITNAVQGFAGTASNLIQGFVNGVMGLFNQLANAGAGLWAMLQNAVAGFAGSASNLIQNFIAGASNLFQGFGNTGSGILSTLTNAISGMASSGMNSISGFISNAISGFSNMLNSGQNTSSGLITTLGNAASSILSNFSGAFGGVGNAMGQMASAGSSALDVISAGAKTAAGAIGGFIGDLLKFHEGGSVPHLGQNEVMAVLQPGEFVVNRDMASRYAGLVEAINEGRVDDYWDGLPGKQPWGGYVDAIMGPIASNVGWSFLPENPIDIGVTDVLKSKAAEYTVKTGAHFLGDYANKVAGLDRVQAYEGMADTIEQLFGKEAAPAVSSLKAQAKKIEGYAALGKLAGTVVGTAIGGPVLGGIIGAVGAHIGSYFSTLTDDIFGGALADLAVKHPGQLISDAILKGELGFGQLNLGVTTNAGPIDAQKVMKGLLEGIVRKQYTPLMVRNIFEGAGSKVEKDVYGAIALNSKTYTEALNNWEDMVGVGAVPGFNPRADFKGWLEQNAGGLFGTNYSLGWFGGISSFFGGLLDSFVSAFKGLGAWIDSVFGGTDPSDPTFHDPLEGIGGGGGGGGGGAPGGGGGYGGTGGEGGGHNSQGPGGTLGGGVAGGGWIEADPSRPFSVKSRRGNFTDRLAAMLAPGEFVVNARQARAWGPLLEMINAGGFSPTDDLRVAAARAAKLYRGAPFRAMAEGGDVMLTRPTLFLGGEAGPERVSFAPRGRVSHDPPVTITGPIIASDMTMTHFVRELDRLLDKERRRISGASRTKS